MTDGVGGFGSERADRRRRDKHGTQTGSSRSLLLPVCLGVGGAVLALIIGIIASAPSSPGPAKSSTAAHASRGSSASSTSTTSGNPVACTPGDMSITTTTDRASYSASSAITIVTKLMSQSLCELDLVATGQYKCGESVVVDTLSGQQAFPAQGQGEQCGSLPSGIIKPGTVDSATIVWSPSESATSNQRAGTTTRYAAVGSWSWDSGRGQPPYEVAADSAPFVISG